MPSPISLPAAPASRWEQDRRSCSKLPARTPSTERCPCCAPPLTLTPSPPATTAQANSSTSKATPSRSRFPSPPKTKTPQKNYGKSPSRSRASTFLFDHFRTFVAKRGTASPELFSAAEVEEFD